MPKLDAIAFRSMHNQAMEKASQDLLDSMADIVKGNPAQAKAMRRAMASELNTD
jgi:hypothetical protein